MSEFEDLIASAATVHCHQWRPNDVERQDFLLAEAAKAALSRGWTTDPLIGPRQEERLETQITGLFGRVKRVDTVISVFHETFERGWVLQESGNDEGLFLTVNGHLVRRVSRWQLVSRRPQSGWRSGEFDTEWATDLHSDNRRRWAYYLDGEPVLPPGRSLPTDPRDPCPLHLVRHPMYATNAEWLEKFLPRWIANRGDTPLQV